MIEDMPGRTQGWGTWTIAGLGIGDVEHWQRADVAVSGLEAIVPRPIDRTTFPTDNTSDRWTYEAEVVPDTVPATSRDGITAHCQYSVTRRWLIRMSSLFGRSLVAISRQMILLPSETG